jgi:PKD repeat protein
VVQHTYEQAGDWTATVTASNSVGWASASTLVSVERTVVDVAIEGLAAINDSPTLLGQATTLTATVTAGSDVAYSWAFGDGTSSTGEGAVVQFTYPASGDYVAIVTASNSVGLVTTTTTVSVTPHRVYLPCVLRDH